MNYLKYSGGDGLKGSAMLKTEIRFRVYTDEGFTETCYLNDCLFQESGRRFTKSYLINVAKWLIKQMNDYNRGIRMRKF